MADTETHLQRNQLSSRLKRVAVLYSFGSVFIGPAIISFALGRGRVGGDCSDSTWDHVPAAVQDAYYHQAAIISATGAILMLLVGATILYFLIRRPKSAVSITLIALVLLMLAGYTLILCSSSSWNC
jgi:hypothetical protein